VNAAKNDKVKKTKSPIRIARRSELAAQLVAVPSKSKRGLIGCMEGTAKFVGDIESPATDPSDWDVLR